MRSTRAARQGRRAADGERAALREGGPPGGRRPCGPAEVDAMKGAQSISTRRAYGVQRICRVWGRARSSDSGDAPSVAANAACDWPSAIRHARSVRGSTTSHHAIGAGHWEARGWRSAYFSQPILEGDRSLFSPTPSPLVPRQRAQSTNSLGKWHARQDSNLRPSA